MIITLEGEEAKAYIAYLSRKISNPKTSTLVAQTSNEGYRVMSEEVAKAIDIASEIPQPEVDNRTDLPVFEQESTKKATKKRTKKYHKWTVLEDNIIHACATNKAKSIRSLDYIMSRFDNTDGTISKRALISRINKLGYKYTKGVIDYD